jgi:hypothetical protein
MSAVKENDALEFDLSYKAIKKKKYGFLRLSTEKEEIDILSNGKCRLKKP